MIHLGGFDESTWICPEDRNGCQPSHWQTAGGSPEIKNLLGASIPGARPAAGFQLPSAPPASAPDNNAPVNEAELSMLLAAMNRRLTLIEAAPAALRPVETPAASRPAEPAAAAPRSPEAAAPLAKISVDPENINALHARMEALEQNLHSGHSDYLKALAELDHKTQKGLKDVVVRMENVLSKGAQKALETTKKDTNHWLVNWDGIKDPRAALGGLFTMATGILVAIGGLVGLFFKIKNLKPEEWGTFLATIPQNPFVVAIVGSGAVISTGLHQIGLANNHAEVMDSHQQLMDSHANLVATINNQNAPPRL